ncbi:hypothetical protein GCM10020001_090690 [Nonomuraea salmonea]
MILTLTLNPSLDRTIEISSLDRGAVIRAAAARLDPGGKGVNVSRALLANAVASRAVVPYGGDEGRQLVRLLAAEGLDMVTVPVAGATRSNVTLAEPDGTVTKVNEPGTALSPAELDTIAEAVLDAAHSGGQGADWVVASGSLPPEVPADVYALLCRRFAGAGINVAVDTSGPALSCALPAAPTLVKPNLEELSAATGLPIRRLGDVVAAAGELRAAGGPYGAGQSRRRRRRPRRGVRRLVRRGARRRAAQLGRRRRRHARGFPRRGRHRPRRTHAGAGLGSRRRPAARQPHAGPRPHRPQRRHRVPARPRPSALHRCPRGTPATRLISCSSSKGARPMADTYTPRSPEPGSRPPSSASAAIWPA